MLEVTVKTLDGKNRTFSVEDDITVNKFKEEIASSIEIEAGVQRIIFQGRVLPDEKKLNEYDVNGKTVHVVQRVPPQIRQHREQTTAESNTTRPRRPTANHPNRVMRDINNLMGRLNANSNLGGNSMDVQFNFPQNEQSNQSEAKNRIDQAEKMIKQAKDTLDKLDNPVISDDKDTLMEQSHTESKDNTKSDTTINPDLIDKSCSSKNINVGSDSKITTSTNKNEISVKDTPDISNVATTSNDPQNVASGSSTADSLQDPHVSVLADLLEEVMSVNDRFSHYLIRFQTSLRNNQDFAGKPEEMCETSKICEITSQTMHLLSHVYHNISDLVVDFNQFPDNRKLTAEAPRPRQATAIFQQTIPVQVSAHINVSPLMRDGIQQPSSISSSSSTTTSASNSSTNTTNSSSTSDYSTSSSTGGINAGSFQTAQPPFSFPDIPGFSGGPHAFHINLGTGPLGAGITPNLPPNFMNSPINASGPGIAPRGFQIFMEMASPLGEDSNSTPHDNERTLNLSSSTTSGTTNAFTSGQPVGVTTANPLSAFSSDNGAGFLPNDFLQNIIQMATGAAMQSSGNPPGVFMLSSQNNFQPVNLSNIATGNNNNVGSTNRTTIPPTISSNTEHVSNSGYNLRSSTNNQSPTLGPAASSGVFSNSTRHSNHQVNSIAGTNNAPNGEAMNLFQSLYAPPSDFYLPCHSRHFASRVRTGGAETPQNQQEQPNSDGLRTNRNFEQTVAGMVSNIMNSLVGSSNEEVVETGAATGNLELNQQIPVNNNNFETSFNFGTLASGLNPFVSLGNMSNLSSNHSNWYTTLCNFFSHIGSYLNLRKMGIDNDFFKKVLLIISNHLQFADAMLLLKGKKVPLQSLRQPLLKFLDLHLMRSGNATNEELVVALDRVLNKIKKDSNKIEALVIREDVNFEDSLINLIKSTILSINTLVRSQIDDAGFSNELQDIIKTSFHKFVNLSRYSIIGGDTVFQSSFQHCLSNIDRSISSGPDLMIQQLSSEILSLLRAIPENYEFIKPLISARISDQTQIKNRAEYLDDEDTVSSAGSYESASAVMLVDEKSDFEKMEEDLTSEHKDEQMVDGHYPRIPHDLLCRLPLPPVEHEIEYQREAEGIIIGSEEWHSVVPKEWVPVIAKDISKQRRMDPHQPPSDAYLSGVPPKRRKLMIKERSENLNSVPNNLCLDLSDSIALASEQIGVNPLSSHQDMMEEIASNVTLCSTYREAIHGAVRRRLEEDSTYISDKYPNADKYFMSKK